MSNALVVVDVQRGFDDASFGRRNNPDCEVNVNRLIAAWRRIGQPVVFVRHDSKDDRSPLRAGQPGNGFKPALEGEPDVLVTKEVHSAFHGAPDLDRWLRKHAIVGVTVCGIQTNMCCETTARVASDLGFDMTFVADATHTFDLPGVSAEDLVRATVATLRADFGTVATTAEVIRRSQSMQQWTSRREEWTVPGPGAGL